MSLSIMKRAKVWLTPLYERLPEQCFPTKSRSFHGFCVGMPKTGTVSIAKMFEQNYRSEHESEIRFYSYHMLDYLQGRCSHVDMQAYLKQRDRRLQLEMDSSYLNAEGVGLLMDTFPDAKFVLTIRDCFSWLESFVNFQSLKPSYFTWRRNHVKRYMEHCFPNQDWYYPPEEALFRDRQFIPLDICFDYWRRQNEAVLQSVPADRLLVIRTDQLDASNALLESFFELPSGTLPSEVRANCTMGKRERVIDTIPPDYLWSKATVHCAELMERFFPDIWSKGNN